VFARTVCAPVFPTLEVSLRDQADATLAMISHQSSCAIRAFQSAVAVMAPRISQSQQSAARILRDCRL
jgi:ABC-type thiamine transport system ATPase subunit